jgi:hypothetical protein
LAADFSHPRPDRRTHGDLKMKYALLAAILMTLPGIAALIYSLFAGPQWLTYAALASLGLNSLPFLAAGFFMRKSSGADLGGHH